MNAKPKDIVIANARIVLADRVIKQGWLALADGRIAEVGEGRAPAGAEDALDADNALVGRLTVDDAKATGGRKDALDDQLILATAHQEEHQDEVDDAKADLERARLARLSAEVQLLKIRQKE